MLIKKDLYYFVPCRTFQFSLHWSLMAFFAKVMGLKKKTKYVSVWNPFDKTLMPSSWYSNENLLLYVSEWHLLTAHPGCSDSVRTFTAASNDSHTLGTKPPVQAAVLIIRASLSTTVSTCQVQKKYWYNVPQAMDQKTNPLKTCGMYQAGPSRNNHLFVLVLEMP